MRDFRLYIVIFSSEVLGNILAAVTVMTNYPEQPVSHVTGDLVGCALSGPESCLPESPGCCLLTLRPSPTLTPQIRPPPGLLTGEDTCILKPTDGCLLPSSAEYLPPSQARPLDTPAAAQCLHWPWEQPPAHGWSGLRNN